MEQVITILSKVIHTLNRVSVEGEENLDHLLGCIQTLKKLKTVFSREEETHETNNQ